MAVWNASAQILKYCTLNCSNFYFVYEVYCSYRHRKFNCRKQKYWVFSMVIPPPTCRYQESVPPDCILKTWAGATCRIMLSAVVSLENPWTQVELTMEDSKGCPVRAPCFHGTFLPYAWCSAIWVLLWLVQVSGSLLQAFREAVALHSMAHGLMYDEWPGMPASTSPRLSKGEVERIAITAQCKTHYKM